MGNCTNSRFDLIAHNNSASSPDFEDERWSFDGDEDEVELSFEPNNHPLSPSHESNRPHTPPRRRSKLVGAEVLNLSVSPVPQPLKIGAFDIVHDSKASLLSTTDEESLGRNEGLTTSSSTLSIANPRLEESDLIEAISIKSKILYQPPLYFPPEITSPNRYTTPDQNGSHEKGASMKVHIAAILVGLGLVLCSVLLFPDSPWLMRPRQNEPYLPDERDFAHALVENGIVITEQLHKAFRQSVSAFTDISTEVEDEVMLML